ncbi:MAG TPA: hypothetical protein VFN74_20840 [Chloroflexota bacterium]|nr:hypothetical protein [Chloroflexota bacterium]
MTETQRPRPHPSLAILEPLVGEWAAEFEDPGHPGTTLRATTVFEWLLGGRFLLQLSTAPSPFPSGHCLIGRSDPDDGSSPLIQHYFDSRGVVRKYVMTFDGRSWTLERKGDDDFDQRFRGAISEDGATLTGTWETSDGPGQPLHDDFDVAYRRVR